MPFVRHLLPFAPDMPPLEDQGPHLVAAAAVPDRIDLR
jgi:hypothetical protein